VVKVLCIEGKDAQVANLREQEMIFYLIWLIVKHQHYCEKYFDFYLFHFLNIKIPKKFPNRKNSPLGFFHWSELGRYFVHCHYKSTFTKADTVLRFCTKFWLKMKRPIPRWTWRCTKYIYKIVQNKIIDFLFSRFRKYLRSLRYENVLLRRINKKDEVYWIILYVLLVFMQY